MKTGKYKTKSGAEIHVTVREPFRGRLELAYYLCPDGVHLDDLPAYTADGRHPTNPELDLVPTTHVPFGDSE